MVLAAKALLEKNPNPSEADVRDAFSGILDRESGYVKPVQAVLQAAAIMRGEEPDEVMPMLLKLLNKCDVRNPAGSAKFLRRKLKEYRIVAEVH